MIDYGVRLTAALDTILPTYYENFVDENTDTPCITYLPMDNHSTIEGDTMRFSNLVYRIKVWGTDYDEITNYCLLMDAKMKELGFIRTSYNELCVNGMYQLISRYSGTGYEIYGG